MEINFKQSIIGSAIAFIIATSCCWLPFLAIAVGSASGLAGLNAGLEKFSGLFMVVGAGFLGLGIFQFNKKNKMNNTKTGVILFSILTCPNCGHKKEEEMPTNACQYFYECENCKHILKPKGQDCCVYCSYGTVPCPPIQEDKSCC